VIVNERQYAITKAELRRFEQAAADQRRRGPSEGVDSRLGEVMVDALLSQAETLRGELGRYEDLREGRISERELEDLRDLPTALIEARIAAGLTQRTLGERLGVGEQQVERWEGSLYAGVRVKRLWDVADAIGAEVRGTARYAVRS